LEREGIGVAITAERELALGLMDHALRSLGIPEEKARSIVQDGRASGEGGAFERRPDLDPPHGAPELRPHRDETSFDDDAGRKSRIIAGSRPDAHPLRRTVMPKGQQRSNREAKKPKQPKKPAPPAAPFGGGPFKTPAAVPGRKA
ncbi:MAG: hypothetical protein ABWY12_00730, partial [Burkholderiales bacterium]